MPVLPNLKHEFFAQALAKGISGAEAYRSAGYAATGNSAAVNANRLLKVANVSARVSELLSLRNEMAVKSTEKAVEALSIDREWVLGLLKENAERAMQIVEVKDHKGTGTGEYKYEGAVANRALELLGKELGMFIDRKDVTVRNSPSELSDSELEAIIRGPRSEDRPHSIN